MPDGEANIRVTFAPQFTASEDEKTYTIHTSKGWDIFRECMADEYYNGFDNKTVLLANDISITKPSGPEGYRFSGTFNGQGKTLTVDLTATGEFCAPFPYVAGDAIIRNLTVNGSITSEYGYAAGLVGHQDNGISIESCRGNVVIDSNGGSAGGFVGLSEDEIPITDSVSSAVIKASGGNNSGFIAWTRSKKDKKIRIEGCLFNGKLLKKDSTSSLNAAFIGWKGDEKEAYLSCCIYDPAPLEPEEEYLPTAASPSAASMQAVKQTLKTAIIRNPLVPSRDWSLMSLWAAMFTLIPQARSSIIPPAASRIIVATTA